MHLHMHCNLDYIHYNSVPQDEFDDLSITLVSMLELFLEMFFYLDQYLIQSHQQYTILMFLTMLAHHLLNHYLVSNKNQVIDYHDMNRRIGTTLEMMGNRRGPSKTALARVRPDTS